MILYLIIALIFLGILLLHRAVASILHFRGVTLHSDSLLYWFAVLLASLASAFLFWNAAPINFDFVFGARVVLLVVCVLLFTVACQLASPTGLFRRKGTPRPTPDEQSTAYNEAVFNEFLQAVSRILTGALMLCLPVACALFYACRFAAPALFSAVSLYGASLDSALVSTVDICLFVLMAVSLRQLVWCLRCFKKSNRSPELLLERKRHAKLQAILREKNKIL